MCSSRASVHPLMVQASEVKESRGIPPMRPPYHTSLQEVALQSTPWRKAGDQGRPKDLLASLSLAPEEVRASLHNLGDTCLDSGPQWPSGCTY